MENFLSVPFLCSLKSACPHTVSGVLPAGTRVLTSALVWCRLKSSGTLQKHGFIEQSADNLRDSLGAFCRKKLEQLE